MIENKIEVLEKTAQKVLELAKKKGATAAETALAYGHGFSVNVRMGDVETVEHHQDQSVSLTVYCGLKQATVSTSDCSDASIEQAVSNACNMAKFTQEDPYAGLADPALMAKNKVDLDLNYPWPIDTQAALNIALDCETYARNLDKRITNSEGAFVSSGQTCGVYANSHGFMGGELSSSHSLSCCLLTQVDQNMERDYYYTAARDPKELESIEAVAKKAVMRTTRRLGARRIKTCKVPVLFEADVAKSLIGAFIGAITGSSLYQKASFLVDSLGNDVFSKEVTIYEDPYQLKGWGSAYFDGDGVQTVKKPFVSNGVLKSYILGIYAARKLGMQTTANAGGVHNLFVNGRERSFEQMLKEMGRGLLVTELIGQGVNLVTGDYSKGVFGFWVENGEIQYPVSEITIAGNLKDIYKQILAIGSDVDRRGNIQTGSILVEQMTVAGT